MLEVKNVSAAYGQNIILDGVSFSLEKGTITALLGANGSGKTTLLKAICGIVPCRGQVTLEQTQLLSLGAKKLANLVSYIPQRSGISIDMTAMEVVLMGFNPQLSLLQQPAASMKEEAAAWLSLVGIEKERNYLTLSEGQKQLCVLARTMVSKAKLLLLDEPESALDFQKRYEMFDRLRGWMKDRAVLAALHDPQLALQMADQLILLKDKKVDAVLHPKTDDRVTMERALSRIYGTIGLHDIGGTLVMVRQENRHDGCDESISS